MLDQQVISRDRDILGGTPVFAGTREQAVGVLEIAIDRLSKDDEAAA